MKSSFTKIIPSKNIPSLSKEEYKVRLISKVDYTQFIPTKIYKFQLRKQRKYS